jgi:hypothetical protein
MLRFPGICVCGRDVAYPDPSAMSRSTVPTSATTMDFVTCGKDGGVVCPDLQCIKYMRARKGQGRTFLAVWLFWGILSMPTTVEKLVKREDRGWETGRRRGCCGIETESRPWCHRS